MRAPETWYRTVYQSIKAFARLIMSQERECRSQVLNSKGVRKALRHLRIQCTCTGCTLAATHPLLLSEGVGEIINDCDIVTMSSSNQASDKKTNEWHSQEPAQHYGQSSALAHWRQQLITKEDPFHLHKILGILCLVSFIFRLSQMGNDSDMGFLAYPELTVPTIILHLLLNLSAFQFRLPKKRITSGYRIWPEYRLHSLVFLVRSLAFIGLYWYEERYQNGEPNTRLDFVFVLGGLLAADLCSQSQGNFRSKSIRDLDVPKAVKFLFSVAQFFGTGNAIFGMRRYTFHMLFVIIVQVNAFLMTLQRKNLGSQTVLLTFYGLFLLMGVYTCARDYYISDEKAFYASVALRHGAIVQRMAPWPDSVRTLVSNKYVVWTTFYALTCNMRAGWMESATVQQLQALYWMTFVALMGLGWYKNFGPGSRQSSSSKEVW